MKARIIGTIIVLAVLAGLYLAFSDSPTAAPQQQQTQLVSPSDSSFKDLKIN